MADDVAVVVLQGCRNSNYLFSIFGFVCYFAGYCGVVLVMEWNPCCSIENLYGECESRFLETIGAKLSKEWRDVDK